MNNAPKWNIESEYPSLESQEFINDLKWCEDELESLKSLDANNFTAAFLKIFEIEIILSTLMSYTHACQTIDTGNKKTKQIESQLQSLTARIRSLSVPIESWFKNLSDIEFEKYILDPALMPFRFQLSESRKLKNIQLSDPEEKNIRLLSVPGYKSWASLYSQISGSARVTANIGDQTKDYSLSELSSFLRSDDSSVREVAWKSIQKIWRTHEDSAAAIINGLADWRMEVNKLRSKKSSKKIDHLFFPLHLNRMSMDALNSMLDSCKDSLPNTRNAYYKMAKKLKKDRLDPWDLLAGIPSSGKPNVENLTDYNKAIDLIAHALNPINPELSEFVKMMDKNQWIEGRVLPEKSQGGYCTHFSKSRTPRIFMTYRGSVNDIMTLAHELGHAYHSWIMRDMHHAQTHYPSNLAETASIFFETAVRDQLLLNAKSESEKQSILWSELEAAGSFLINIPARFEFEHQMNLEKEKTGLLTASDLCRINKTAWEKWYGDTISQTDEFYWASKLHFSLTMPFYNFPYAFGYLFSLGVYSKRNEWGNDFLKKYKSLLRDTGQMTADDLSLKHLGQNISDKSFWQSGINLIVKKINAFEVN